MSMPPPRTEADEDRIRRRLRIRGRVQGVGFRAATQRAARRAGLAGWVRNRPDGSVEAVFEGPAEAVEQIVLWCRRGPPAAVVAALDAAEEPSEGLREFEFR